MTEVLIWIYNHTIAPILVCAYFGFLISIPVVILHGLYEYFCCGKNYGQAAENSANDGVSFFGDRGTPLNTHSSSDMFHNITTYTTNPTYSNLPSNIGYNRDR